MSKKFPMRIDFSLGRVKNEDSSIDTNSLQDLYTLINTKVSNNIKRGSINILNTDLDINSIESIQLIESSIPSGSHSNLTLNYTTPLTKSRYYLVVDSNMSSIGIDPLYVEGASPKSTRNRTMYVLHPLSDTEVVITNCIKDTYLTEESDFDMEDFAGWDMNI